MHLNSSLHISWRKSKWMNHVYLRSQAQHNKSLYYIKIFTNTVEFPNPCYLDKQVIHLVYDINIQVFSLILCFLFFFYFKWLIDLLIYNILLFFFYMDIFIFLFHMDTSPVLMKKVLMKNNLSICSALTTFEQK